MKASQPVVVVGVGQLGAFLGMGFLLAGYSLVPVRRGQSLGSVPVDQPALVLVAVGEADLPSVLADLPESFRSGVVLLQNELLPADWEPYGLSPTVLVAWFERKQGRPIKTLLPSLVFGRGSEFVEAALKPLGVAFRRVSSEQEMLLGLIDKNLYILTTNLAGLRYGGSVSELLGEQQEFCREVFADVLRLQSSRACLPLDFEERFVVFEGAVRADPDHACSGRSAPARLARALGYARQHGIKVPILESLERHV